MQTTKLRLRNTMIFSAIFSCIFCALYAAPAATTRLPFGPWKRASNQPVISPAGKGFESAGTFNPAVIKKEGEFIMLYRAQGSQGTSTLGYATSRDGVHFTRQAAPVFGPQAPYEKGGGTEDPRLVRIGGAYYLTYTGYNNVDGKGPGKKDAQLCLATSTDLIHWTRHGVIMPAYRGKWNIGWTKSGAIVPEKINGKYWMYYLGDARGHPSQMGVAESDDLLHWTDATDRPVLASRPGSFDARVVEPGPPPVVTPEGILLIYNGADDHLVYSTGWALFDKNNPARVLARASTPIFRPVLPWERTGQTPNVVFVEGLARSGSRWLFYYGSADQYVGVAVADSR
ncbi:MAG TPA: glycoside hydrolase family 130 protein [Terriglobia bacterium]|nr:glycoside hydrolase family 130 protein [Terriglobia bacterium]